MSITSTTSRSRLWLYVGLALVLFCCLWIGWRDFDPTVPQDEVRENIRSVIRWVLQALVQYAIPLAILVSFAREAVARYRSRTRAPGADS